MPNKAVNSKRNTKKVNIRQDALDLIYNVVILKKTLDGLLEDRLSTINDSRDKAFLHTLVYGVLRNYKSLVKTSNTFLEKPLNKTKSKKVLIILTISLYELYFLKNKSYAVVNEAVNLAKKTKLPWAKGLVNAVLKSWLKSPFISFDENKDHPKWLFDRISSHYPTFSEGYFIENHNKAPLTLRPHKKNVDFFLEKECENFAFERHPYVKSAITAKNNKILDTEFFKKGDITVQDANAQLAAYFLKVYNGESFLDSCAAPGGKTSHIAMEADKKGYNINIFASDNNKNRIEKMRKTFSRLDIKCTVFHFDMTGDDKNIPSCLKKGMFEKILLDVPCSGTGVIRRHPDMLHLRTSEQVDELIKTQRKLLDYNWSLLSVGGEILYSTCSVLKEENQEQVVDFLRRNSDASIIPLKYPSTEHYSFLEDTMGMIQIFPSHLGDGFFYALLKKS